MTHDEAHALAPGTLVVTAYPPRSICRFVCIVRSQWSMQLECVHRSMGYGAGALMLHYYSGVEPLSEASICMGHHQELMADGSCMRCGFSREAQKWETLERESK